jgi:hypothetical protein
MAFVIPEDEANAENVGGGNRVTTGGRLGVYRTEDRGSNWELVSNGLPERAWVEVAGHLPAVLSVEVAEWQ